jgi:subtilisin family serine protease
MSRKYVILRTEKPKQTRSIPGAGAAAAAPAEAPKVEVDELEPRSAARLAQEKNTSVAPVIPMKLIEPVADSPGAAPAAPGPTWGVKAVGADTSTFTGAGIVAAILDTGIDSSHSAFSGVQLERRNFTSESDEDQHGHGTHCAGTVFGRDVNGTRIGVAPGITKAFIGKVLGAGGGGSDQIVQAIQWAVNGGANVISMSLGIDFPGFVKELEDGGLPTELATSVALEGYRTNILLFERLASFISAQGAFGSTAILVAAAGNESQRQVNADFEISVSPPAVADGIVSVAALGTSAQGFMVADFSNVGARLSGPGVNIQSAKVGGGLRSMSGTSMATPHVAGVAALWAQKLAAENQLNGQLLAARLVSSATTNGMRTGFDPGDIGAGMVQAPQN